MLGLRITPPGPYWFEDLVFLVLDGGRRAAERTARATRALKGLARRTTDDTVATLLATPARLLGVPAQATAADTHATPPLRQAELLDEPLAWTLATEPLATAAAGTASAISLHEAASEQLDAVSYTLARIRDEVRPLLTYARLADDTVQHLPSAAELETSIEALLELSRRNAATRPKNRTLTAA